MLSIPGCCLPDASSTFPQLGPLKVMVAPAARPLETGERTEMENVGCSHIPGLGSRAGARASGL